LRRDAGCLDDAIPLYNFRLQELFEGRGSRALLGNRLHAEFSEAADNRRVLERLLQGVHERVHDRLRRVARRIQPIPGGDDDIESVTVQGSQLLLDRGDRAVNSERDARVSIHHGAACGLLLGAAGVREFSQTVVFEPAVVRFRDKVRAQLDASLPDGAALVTVRTASGKIFRETVMSARGSLADPLSDADIENKLCECIHTDGNSCDPDNLIESVWRLEQLPDVAGLMKASRGERP